jgi:hypothetical protein
MPGKEGKGRAGGKADRFERKEDKQLKKEAKDAEKQPVAPVKPAPPAGPTSPMQPAQPMQARTPVAVKTIKVSFTNSASAGALLYLVDDKGADRYIHEVKPAEHYELTCPAGATLKAKVSGKEMKVVASMDGAAFKITADQIMHA